MHKGRLCFAAQAPQGVFLFSFVVGGIYRALARRVAAARVWFERLKPDGLNG